MIKAKTKTKNRKRKRRAKDEPQTIRVTKILHMATTNQNTWRACRVESTTQRDHKQRAVRGNEERLQRQRIQELKADRRGKPAAPFGAKVKTKNKKIKVKGTPKGEKVKNHV